MCLRPRLNPGFVYKSRDNLTFGPLHDDRAVMRVADLMSGLGRDLWIEGFAPGDSYLFLVLDAVVVSVLKPSAPQVTGDGYHNISRLDMCVAKAGDLLLVLIKASGNDKWSTLQTLLDRAES